MQTTISKATNFDARITRATAHRFLKEGTPDRLKFSIMCREYGGDSDWCEVTADDLDDVTGLLDDDFRTFEIWLGNCAEDDFINALTNEPDFINWRDSDNVVAIEDGLFIEQTTQYRKRFTLFELFQFWEREYNN